MPIPGVFDGYIEVVARVSSTSGDGETPSLFGTVPLGQASGQRAKVSGAARYLLTMR
jgi:hypothetical protein